MKLFYTPIPYLIHKAQVAAIHAGVYEKLERIPTNPFKRDPAHVAANPLSKVPTLVLDDGTPLYGGPVIYEYLDSLHNGPKLFPASGPERWLVLRRLALADGMWDVAVQREGESGRPAEFQYAAEIEKHGATVNRCLDQMEKEASTYRGFTIDQVSAACGLMYFDRLVMLKRPGAADWRPGRPTLAAWYQEFVKHPAMRPHDNEFRAAFNEGDTRSRWGTANALRPPAG
ncbi:MAG: glutathione S-transferase [Alphaproteobacteria bacterium]|nr:glutathione S-transferase [Alphaproteobacteria bacterium]